MSGVIIFGDASDAHVLTVHSKIQSRGMRSILLSDDGAVPVSIRMGWDGSLSCEGLDLLDQGTVIWDRVKPRMIVYDGTEETRSEYARNAEWKAFYFSILPFLEGRVVNSRRAKFLCGHKLFQQHLAARLGLAVPPSLVTTSRQSAVAFAEEHGPLIAKMIGYPRIPSETGRFRSESVMTSLVTTDHLHAAHDEQFASTPTFLQKMLNKEHELRVSIVGEQVFSFKIDSQSREYTRIDWRYGNQTLKFEPWILEDTLEKKLKAFLSECGLHYGHFDLIVDGSGQTWFLECNADGQWMWLDQEIGGHISDAFAGMLSRLALSRTASQGATLEACAAAS